MRSKFFEFAHVPFGKPLPTFSEHALARGGENDRGHIRSLAEGGPKEGLSRYRCAIAAVARKNRRLHIYRALREPLRARQDPFALVLPGRSGGCGLAQHKRTSDG